MNRFPTENIDKVKAAIAADSATKATQLANSKNIKLTGDVTGTASFNGTSDASISAVVTDDSHNHVISNIDNLQTNLDTLSTNITNAKNASITDLSIDGKVITYTKGDSTTGTITTQDTTYIAGTGISISSNTITNTGVTSVNGTTGEVSVGTVRSVNGVSADASGNVTISTSVVSEKLNTSFSLTPLTPATKTVSNLTPYKPVYVAFTGGQYGCSAGVQTGAVFASSTTSFSGNYNASNWLVFIPTGTSVVILFKTGGDNDKTYTIKTIVYQ